MQSREDYDEAWEEQDMEDLERLKELCKKIKSDIDSERNRTDGMHKNRLLHWLNIRAGHNLFTKDGKRLQRMHNAGGSKHPVGDLDDLFEHAQALNIGSRMVQC